MGCQTGGRPLAAYLLCRRTGRWAVHGRLSEKLHREHLQRAGRRVGGCGPHTCCADALAALDVIGGGRARWMLWLAASVIAGKLCDLLLATLVGSPCGRSASFPLVSISATRAPGALTVAVLVTIMVMVSATVPPELAVACG